MAKYVLPSERVSEPCGPAKLGYQPQQSKSEPLLPLNVMGGREIGDDVNMAQMDGLYSHYSEVDVNDKPITVTSDPQVHLQGHTDTETKVRSHGYIFI